MAMVQWLKQSFIGNVGVKLGFKPKGLTDKQWVVGIYSHDNQATAEISVDNLKAAKKLHNDLVKVFLTTRTGVNDEVIR